MMALAGRSAALRRIPAANSLTADERIRNQAAAWWVWH